MREYSSWVALFSICDTVLSSAFLLLQLIGNLIFFPLKSFREQVVAWGLDKQLLEICESLSAIAADPSVYDQPASWSLPGLQGMCLANRLVLLGVSGEDPFEGWGHCLLLVPFSAEPAGEGGG